MKVITSQRYDDWNIVREMERLIGVSHVKLPVWDPKVKDYDGNDLFILPNGYHTYRAARELGIKVDFEVTSSPRGLTGDELLEYAYTQDDYHYIDTGIIVW